MNDVIPEYLLTGRFRPRSSLKTISNAMDVGDPSNFERLQVAFGGSVGQMRKWIRGIRITDPETRRTMRRVYEEAGMLIDPHTAVGVLAARRYREQTGYRGQILSLATAHPGKFLDTVREATGVTPDLPAALTEALSKEKQAVALKPSLDLLRGFLLDRYS